MQHVPNCWCSSDLLAAYPLYRLTPIFITFTMVPTPAAVTWRALAIIALLALPGEAGLRAYFSMNDFVGGTSGPARSGCVFVISPKKGYFVCFACLLDVLF